MDRYYNAIKEAGSNPSQELIRQKKEEILAPAEAEVKKALGQQYAETAHSIQSSAQAKLAKTKFKGREGKKSGGELTTGEKGTHRAKKKAELAAPDTGRPGPDAPEALDGSGIKPEVIFEKPAKNP